MTKNNTQPKNKRKTDAIVLNNELYSPKFLNDWGKESLYNLANWINGRAFKSHDFNIIGLPIMKIAEIKNGLSSQTQYTLKKFDKNIFVKSGDILFSWSGTPETSIDIFLWKGFEGWLNQHTFRVEPKKMIDRKFFYYLLRYLKINFVRIASNKKTTGLGHVTTKDLKNITVGVPQESYQKEIADILSAFDDKIELNNKINHNLEQTAQAILKNTELFNKGGGDKLGDLMAQRKEKFRKYEDWKNLKLLDLGRFPQKSLAITGYGRGEEIKTAGTGFKKGDILFGAVRPYFHKVVIAPFDGVTNSSVFVITPKKESYSAFLATILFSENVISYASMSASGTKMPVIKWEDLCSMELSMPKEKIINDFDKAIRPFYNMIIKNVEENQELASLRDLLLPKLMSGEVRG